MDLASRRIVYHSVQEHDYNNFEAVEILNQALLIDSQFLPYKQVKEIHTDSAGIFLSHNWIEFLKKNSIEDSSADSQRNQNQVSERFNRTFKKLSRDFLNKKLNKTNNKTSTLQLFLEAAQYNFENVKTITQDIIHYYNCEKPHYHLDMLTPDTWAFQARQLPDHSFLIIPKQHSSNLSENYSMDIQDQTTFLQKIENLQELNLNFHPDIKKKKPQNFLDDINRVHTEFELLPFDSISQNDNSEKAIAIRKHRQQIVTKTIRDSLEAQGLQISSFDQPTQEAFKILEAENKQWEETEVRALQTIMLQNQILFTSIEDLKKQLEERDQRIESQTQTIKDQNDYLVQVTRKNEHEKQQAQERKLKRLTAKKKEPLDCVTLDEFYKIMFEIIPTYQSDSYIQSRMKIGLFIMYFTGLRVANPLILTVRQFEELIQSEYGTEIVLSKQKKGQPAKLQTITLGEDARNLLIDEFYHDVMTILKNKSKQAAVFTKQGEETSLSREHWTNELNKILRLASAQFNKNIKSHSFRITFATDGINSQIPLLQMKSMLAHKSVATTQHYVRHELSKPEITAVLSRMNKSRANNFIINIRKDEERNSRKKKTLKFQKTFTSQDENPKDQNLLNHDD